VIHAVGAHDPSAATASFSPTSWAGRRGMVAMTNRKGSVCVFLNSKRAPRGMLSARPAGTAVTEPPDSVPYQPFSEPEYQGSSNLPEARGATLVPARDRRSRP
jgi:hypothetical protein